MVGKQVKLKPSWPPGPVCLFLVLCSDGGIRSPADAPKDEGKKPRASPSAELPWEGGVNDVLLLWWLSRFLHRFVCSPLGWFWDHPVIKCQSCWEPAVPVMVSHGGCVWGYVQSLAGVGRDCVTNPGCFVISHDARQKRGLLPIIGRVQAMLVSSVQKKMLKKSR